MSNIQKEVDFSIIRYANCWEDADVLLQALALAPGADICCIASAGDNALALLATHPNRVDAFDISPVQLHLTELKKCAFNKLSHEELLKFLGVNHTAKEERIKLFEQLQNGLSNAANNYWKQHLSLIENGVINTGKFEHYFKLFRRWFLPLVHSQKTVAHLLEAKTAESQKAFYKNTWNNWRWQALMAVFFSRFVMGKYGRDPQFLQQVKVPVNQFIRSKAEAHLQSVHCTSNAFLQMIFTGNYQNNLPFYLRRENYDAIKANLHKLNLVQADATQLIMHRPYDAYCLSNIFEYMSANSFEEIVQHWKSIIPQKSKLAFWNLMVPRSFAESDSKAFQKVQVDPTLLEGDAGFFYNRFCLEEKR